MEGSRLRRGSPGPARLRTVPIAVTPEGFWCCPSPAALHKSLKNPYHHGGGGGAGHKQPPPQQHKPPSAPPSKAPSVQTASPVTDEPAPVVEQQNQLAAEAAPDRQQEQQHKICVGFGRPETSDLTVMLYEKEGIAVRMSVHRDVLCQSSVFFAERLAGGHGPPAPSVEIHDCDNVEIYVETVGLMYCDEAKHRLLKQSVSRVLRIMKVAELLGFHACVKSCLDYLEAVPWVGDEEDNVVSSIWHLQSKDYGVSPLLKRITSDNLNSPSDTLANIMEMVLTSTDDKGRREMKALVLNLLKDSSHCADGSSNICSEMLYSSCRGCLDRLRQLFAGASEEDFSAKVTRQITLETDNLLWLVEILVNQRIGDDFVAIWTSQTELAELHAKLPAASRHTVSCITARLFVGIGRGEVLPSKNTRLLLVQVWLQALIDDYSWLQCSCRSFDRKLVEEGIGQTILTLPLEDQRSILLSWLGRFLKLGDKCPNLQWAFEVWWRRTFVRPYVNEAEAGNVLLSDRSSS
ncbi:BTB/POZ domain-containing protein At3g50780-like [Phragmites australis]|uniref:BTB/POZ domain-containing protein At3g50780-like n=1 Tax=Phragmites australis TaxID=29695 RepID=UPI002D79FA59|nr:BTB/POZ domain-containing protein At3g50780-like [Phragmites australis]XP_062204678.1 BTB/POZ domain-containing protein At3g50780-like [Phragmites australis]XP_062204679.1 BTB/POZ domain-containing protein At3g50780-like [Phragmites australis]